jgi:hypothetical protein
MGSGKKAFCALDLRSLFANYAQLYPQELWISFEHDRGSSMQAVKQGRTVRFECDGERAAAARRMPDPANTRRSGACVSLAEKSRRS